MSNLIRHPTARPTRVGAAGLSRVIKSVTADPAPTGRIMSSLAGAGGLAGKGGIAGDGGGLAA